MKGIKQWYKNLVFRKKVFLSHLALSLIPVVILGVFCYFQTRKLLIQREKEVLKETLEQTVLRMDATLGIYQHVMENLVWDDNLRTVLEQQYQNNLEMYRAYRDVIDPSVRQMKLLNPQIKTLTIYTSNKTLYPHGDILQKIQEAPTLEHKDEDYQVHWKADESGVLELYCQIYGQDRQNHHIVYMELDYSGVFCWLTGLFEENYGVMIANGGASPAFSFATDKEKNGAGGLTLSDLSSGAPSLENYVLEQRIIPANNWKIYLYRPVKAVSSSALSITVLIAAAVGMCLLIILPVSVLMSRSIVQPLTRLIQNIDQIAGENLDVVVREESRDEIGLLIQSFSRMMDRIHYLVNEVYKSKIAQQEYEMRMLQAQINPHFLYNSLSLINWKAIMSDQTEISEMAQLLSTFYRTTLNKGRSVTTVKGEWDNTCSYIRIQRIMHSGKFEVEQQVEPSILECEMLNLILQPLVENAIGHGLDHKEKGDRKKLWVIGRDMGDELEFEVKDNGCGISEEDLRTVLHTRSKGYGLQNVNDRIKLYYGEQYGLQMESRLGEGTRVVVRIPRKSWKK